MNAHTHVEVEGFGNGLPSTTAVSVSDGSRGTDHERWDSVDSVATQLCSTAIALSVFGVPAGSAAGADSTLAGPNVIDYEGEAANGTGAYVMPRFASSERVVIQGEGTEQGGCVFKSTSRLSPGERRTSVELAYDPDTCRSLYEIGTLAAGERLPGVPAEARGTKQELVGRAASPSSKGRSAPLSIEGVGDRHRAYSESWFQDPVGIRVNSLKDEIEWTPGGTCTLAGGTTATMVASYSYFWPTGWFLASVTWTNSGDIIDCNEPVLSQLDVHFQNDAFCTDPGPPPVQWPTDTWYEPDSVQGFADASFLATSVTRKEGFCSVFLQAMHDENNQVVP